LDKRFKAIQGISERVSSVGADIAPVLWQVVGY